MIGIFLAPRRRLRKRLGAGQPDTFPPVLTGLGIGEAQSELRFFGSEAGTLHWVLDNSVSYADADALAAGQAAGAASGTRAGSAGMNTISIDLSGVAQGAWRVHVGVIDAAGNASNVLSGDYIITAGALEMNGDPLEWNGEPLIFNAA